MKRQVPKGEEPVVCYCDRQSAEVFLMTRRDGMFTLYRVDEDGSMKKLGKAKDPVTLEEKYDVEKVVLSL